MKAFVLRFVTNELGATATEYAIIASGVADAIVAVVQNLGAKLNATFSSVSTALK